MVRRCCFAVFLIAVLAQRTKSVRLTVDGIPLEYNSLDDRMQALFRFCKQLSDDCDMPPCPELTTCIATFDPILTNLEDLIHGKNNSRNEMNGSENSDEDVLQQKLSNEQLRVLGNDLVFEVVVDNSGRRANFVHTSGNDVYSEIKAFCSEEMSSSQDIEVCQATMMDAVVKGIARQTKSATSVAERRKSWTKKGSVFFDEKEYDDMIELEVQLDDVGATATFTHAPLQDPFSEAETFCEKQLPSLDRVLCIDQLVGALENYMKNKQKLEKERKMGDDSDMKQTAFLSNTFGNSLISAPTGKSVATDQSLGSNQIIGLYFAADWCKPCRQFTPSLTKYYHMVRDYKRKRFEIVWLSASHTQEGFSAYLGEMPWLALPFENRNLYNSLRAQYGVSSFPTLIFVDAVTGAVVAKNAREAVLRDPNGDGFPYASPIQAIGRFARGLANSLIPPTIKRRLLSSINAITSKL